MKKNISTIIAIISCVAVGVCIVQNANLKREISNLENNLRHQIMNVDDRIDSIYANIDSYLEEQNNLLATREPSWNVEGMDMDAKTATVKFAVIPKEYKQDVTTAVFVCNEKEYPMLFENGKFTAVIQVPLFEENRATEVRFAEKDTVRVQALECNISPRYDLFPSIYVNDFSTESSSHKKDGRLIYNQKGEFEIQIEKRGGKLDVRSVSLLPYIDGKKQKSIELPMNKTSSVGLGGENYVEELWGESKCIYSPMDETFKLPYGSTFELYVEVKDGNGFCYRVKTYHMDVDQMGDYTGTGSSGEEPQIYSEDGKLLYSN